MTDVVIKRLSELDRAHTPLLNDMLHIMRGDKDYHILYGDYVDAILPGLGVDEPKWNAGKLHNVPVVITNPTDKEYIVYNSASNSFINKQILYSDINYGTLGVVNGLEYLKVVSGNLVSSRILTTELQPSNVNAAGKYLRISADGKSVYEDALIQETTIATTDITNLNVSESRIGRITSTTLNRPSGSVGFAFVARQPDGNAAAMITVDTNNGATKVRTHNGGANQDAFTAYHDIYNSRTNPLSDSIDSSSSTNIATSKAISSLKAYTDNIVANSSSGTDSALRSLISSAESRLQAQITTNTNNIVSSGVSTSNEISRLEGLIANNSSSIGQVDNNLRSLVATTNSNIQSQLTTMNNTTNTVNARITTEANRLDGRINTSDGMLASHKTSGDHDGRYLRNAADWTNNTYYTSGNYVYMFVNGAYRQIYPPTWG